MTAEDLLGLLVPATCLFFLFTEALWSARSFPPRKGWQWLGYFIQRPAMLGFEDVNAGFHSAGSLGQQAAQRPSHA
jgi:hypothetical protein